MKGLKEIENSLSNVIQEYKTWFDKNWMISIMLVYKEGNQATYHMAKMALKLQHNYLTRWRQPPSAVAHLQRDGLGFMKPKVLSCC